MPEPLKAPTAVRQKGVCNPSLPYVYLFLIYLLIFTLIHIYVYRGLRLHRLQAQRETFLMHKYMYYICMYVC